MATFDIFLSHNSRDKPAVERLAEKRRVGVFYAIQTPALDPLFIAYNAGAGGRILRTMQSIFRPPSRRPPLACFPSAFRRDAGLKMLCIMLQS